MARDITGVYAGRVELTGGERLIVWVSMGLAVGVLLIGLDLLTAGRLFGGLAAPTAEGEAIEDD